MDLTTTSSETQSSAPAASVDVAEPKRFTLDELAKLVNGTVADVGGSSETGGPAPSTLQTFEMPTADNLAPKVDEHETRIAALESKLEKTIEHLQTYFRQLDL